MIRNISLRSNYLILDFINTQKEEDLTLMFYFEDLVIEVSAIFMLHNIETSTTQVNLKKDGKEAKIQTHLISCSQILGVGELVILYTVFQKKDSVFKWRVNISENKIQLPIIKKKLNFTMNFINSIRLNIKVHI